METIHSVRRLKVEYGRLHPLLTDCLSRNLDAGIALRFIPAYGGLPLERCLLWGYARGLLKI